ncbi:MAG: DHHA1 domain-containing protein, partial [Halobacteriota archaeon]
LRGADEEQFIVVRASDPVSSEELRELGADVVINPPSVIAESALRSLEHGELEHLAQRLASILTAADGPVGIVAGANPDPDTIASAAALSTIADHLGVEAEILYQGEMGHHENRAFANLLGIDLVEFADDADLDEFEVVALIGQRAELSRVDVLFDHEPLETELDVTFVDVRANMSSTSTILTKYVQEFDMPVTESVATALLFGIRSQTLDFKRDTTPADLTAAAYLYPFADHDILEQVESPSMSPETLDVLAEAIRNREVQGSHLISNAGFIHARDALTQAAQQLLNLEGITTVAVFGIDEDTIYIEAQSKDIRMNIGSVLEEAFGEVGEAGGHTTRASAEIPLGIFTGLDPEEEDRSAFLDLIEEAVSKKIYAAIGVDIPENDSNG